MKPVTPKQAREASGMSVELLAPLIPCCRSTWFNHERAEKWPRLLAIRRGAIKALKCVEINGKVYLAKDVKVKK